MKPGLCWVSMLLPLFLCTSCADSFDDVCRSAPLPVDAQGNLRLTGYWLDCPTGVNPEQEYLCLISGDTMKAWVGFNSEPVVYMLEPTADGAICARLDGKCVYNMAPVEQVAGYGVKMRYNKDSDGRGYVSFWRSVKCDM